MSAYKKLNKQDAFITTYIAHKSWAITGDVFLPYGINYDKNVVGGKLNSLQQLYYPNKISGSAPSSSFDYYQQTTLYQSQSRELTTGSFVLSIPKALFGTAIKPGDGFTLRIPSESLQLLAPVQENYVEENYILPYYVGDIEIPVGETVTQLGSVVVIDNGEGQLFLSGSTPKQYVGDIIYPHGIVIITDSTCAAIFKTATTGESLLEYIDLSFKSSQPVFTHNYHCKVRESELNHTQNPSALSSSLKTLFDNTDTVYKESSNVSTGELTSNTTGSEFRPYITTVGLYNDVNQLIAVGKLNRPVPRTTTTEMTIIVKIDI